MKVARGCVWRIGWVREEFVSTLATRDSMWSGALSWWRNKSHWKYVSSKNGCNWTIAAGNIILHGFSSKDLIYIRCGGLHYPNDPTGGGILLDSKRDFIAYLSFSPFHRLNMTVERAVKSSHVPINSENDNVCKISLIKFLQSTPRSIPSPLHSPLHCFGPNKSDIPL